MSKFLLGENYFYKKNSKIFESIFGLSTGRTGRAGPFQLVGRAEKFRPVNTSNLDCYLPGIEAGRSGIHLGPRFSYNNTL